MPAGKVAGPRQGVGEESAPVVHGPAEGRVGSGAVARVAARRPRRGAAANEVGRAVANEAGRGRVNEGALAVAGAAADQPRAAPGTSAADLPRSCAACHS